MTLGAKWGQNEGKEGYIGVEQGEDSLKIAQHHQQSAPAQSSTNNLADYDER